MTSSYDILFKISETLGAMKLLVEEVKDSNEKLAVQLLEAHREFKKTMEKAFTEFKKPMKAASKKQEEEASK